VYIIQAKAGQGTAVFFPIIPLEVGELKLTISADSKLAKDIVIKDLRVEVRKRVIHKYIL